MMWIRMRYYISGGRADGSQWPDVGGLLEVSDDEGQDLITAQVADRAQAPPQEEPAKSVLVSAPEEVQPEEVPAMEESSGAPSPSAPKSEWTDWAVRQGEVPATAAAMTKSDLMSKYGPRL